MRYRDLVEFEPIDTVVQLRQADERAAAEQLVRTYVISDRMADQLANVAIQQIQFLTPRDNKGVLVVGNYGTGKSHLMSVLSAVAEYPDLLDSLSHPRVREAARSIAGRFKVIRVEVGAVRRGLRDILIDEVSRALERWGTPFAFPEATQLTNNKDPLIQAVAKFRERYPDQGILLVVDELLDYLRTREERELILDLGFLRELGEVAELTPFRFVGGLQEALFDNPRFAFVGEQLRRVRDRFEQVRIAREDIAFVVAHRLLKKSDEQLARISEHLRKFTPLYDGLAEKLGEFAQLFPIHPAYIDTFERVLVAEKREVLKTFSLAMRSLLDQEVPADEPGLVSFDHYWDVLRENASMRSLPGVAEVVDRSNTLEGHVRNAYTRPHLQPMAIRIIHALSVYRLTTDDIRAPIGITPEGLRDGLFLFTRTPEQSASFLLSQVQVALREIVRTVGGQFISTNEANGQYYLDVDKDVDFDEKIRERGGLMGESDLNRFFFDALRLDLGLNETTYVTGHRLWSYEVPWTERKVTRPGYLFFGAPDERSTAQPPRDFYVFFLPPFLRRDWQDEGRSDEVVFRLTGLDETFERLVRLYAGARALANESAMHRDTYAARADQQRDRLRAWLRDHLVSHLRVSYQGAESQVGAVVSRARSSASPSLDDLLRLVSSTLLAPDFAERYPDYPTFRFSQPVSENARTADALEAIRFLAGRVRTNLAVGILEGLELVDADGSIRPLASRYAKRYLDLLQSKPLGQVVNRGELIEVVAPGIQPVEKDLFFRLEPEWVAVVLVALAYNGDVVLTFGSQPPLDASGIERAALIAVSDLANFRFYSRPRTLPVSIWAAIFEGLDLQPGLIRDENSRERAVQELQRVVGAELQRTATLQGKIQQGLQLWNTPVFTDNVTYQIRFADVVGSDLPAVSLRSSELVGHLRGYKVFLDTLARFNTVGKLRNLQLTLEQVNEALGDRRLVERAESLDGLVGQLQPLTAYLAVAEATLPSGHEWIQRATAARQALLEDVRRLGKGQAGRSGSELSRDLAELKAGYVAAYAELHGQLVLGPEEDNRRVRLLGDARLAALNELAPIELLQGNDLRALKDGLAGLRTCRGFHEGAIAETPVCPHCHLRPSQTGTHAPAAWVLDQLDRRLDDLLARWRSALRTNLGSDVALSSLGAMTPAERQPIVEFLAQPDDSPAIPPGFAAAAAQALRGIESVTLSADDLLDGLKAGGLPCTVEELQRRFVEHLRQKMRGHDSRNARLSLGE